LNGRHAIQCPRARTELVRELKSWNSADKHKDRQTETYKQADGNMDSYSLTGGFYNTHAHQWFLWIRYLSFITYSYSAFAVIEYQMGAELLYV